MTNPTAATTTITTVTTTGLLTRLLQSVGGVMLGPVLVVGAIALLFWNEGVYDLGNLAATATSVDPSAISAAHDGQLVAATGPVTAASPLGDGLFLRPVPAIALAVLLLVIVAVAAVGVKRWLDPPAPGALPGLPQAAAPARPDRDLDEPRPAPGLVR